MSYNIKNSIIDKLKRVAVTSDVNAKLAAGMMRGKNFIGTPKSNINYSHCNGYHCSSLHAEANAMLGCYGDSLQYHNGRWRFLRKGAREKKGQEDGYCRY